MHASFKVKGIIISFCLHFFSIENFSWLIALGFSTHIWPHYCSNQVRESFFIRLIKLSHILLFHINGGYFFPSTNYSYYSRTNWICSNIEFNQKEVFLNKDFSIFRARNWDFRLRESNSSTAPHLIKFETITIYSVYLFVISWKSLN